MPKQIQSLERGLFILESILFAREPVTAGEIARNLGVHKSTVSHLTSTLIEQGYLEKTPGSAKLYPGPSVFRMTRAMCPPAQIIEASKPLIEKLAGQTGETSHLAELRGRHAFFLYNCYSRNALRVQTETGMIENAHSTAVGKALLSGLADGEIKSMFAGAQLERFTENTTMVLSDLLEEIALVRQTGVAFDREEQTVGTGCIASPVVGAWGRVVTAVGISGPAGRVFVDGTHYETAVIEYAAKISREIQSICASQLTGGRGAKIDKKSGAQGARMN